MSCIVAVLFMDLQVVSDSATKLCHGLVQFNLVHLLSETETAQSLVVMRLDGTAAHNGESFRIPNQTISQKKCQLGLSERHR